MQLLPYRLLLATIGWLVLQSCQSKHEAARAETAAAVAAPASSAAAAPSLAQRFGPIISGGWVNANYLAVLQKTKSPIIAFDSSGYISEININSAAAIGDSLVAGVGYGNHEGGGLTIFFRPGKRANTLLTNLHAYDSPGSYAELGYRINAGDTTLLLTTFNANNQVINTASYCRIRHCRLDQLDNLNLAVNQLFMSGNYVGVDSLKQRAQIRFTADGQVKGWAGIKAYAVNTDFGSGPGNEIDHLTLLDANKHDHLVHFRFRADTLRLYDASVIVTKQHAGTDKETVDEKLTQGKLLFTLIKSR